MRGFVPGPGISVCPLSLYATLNEQTWNDYIAMLKTSWPVSAEQEAEIRGGVVDEKSHAWAREEKDRLIADSGWYQKWKNGDREARATWARVTTILAMKPVPIK